MKTKMTKDRVKHMESILMRFAAEFGEKYRRGQNEHGGVLEDRDCLEEAAQEAVDLVAYITCERVKKAEILKVMADCRLGHISNVQALCAICDIYGLDKP